MEKLTSTPISFLEISEGPDRWQRALALSLLLIVLGLVTLTVSFLTDRQLPGFLGAVLFCSAVPHLICAFLTMKWSSFVSYLLVGLADLNTAIVLWADPATFELSVTTLAAGYFLAGAALQGAGGLFRDSSNRCLPPIGGLIFLCFGMLAWSQPSMLDPRLLGICFAATLSCRGVIALVIVLELRRSQTAGI